MVNTEWQHLTVAHRIRQGTTEAVGGTEWKPKTASGWMEFKEMNIYCVPDLTETQSELI